MHSAVDGLNETEIALPPFRDSAGHLLAEIGCLKLLLHREILSLRARGHLVENEFRGLYVGDEYVDAVLSDRKADEPARAALTRRIHEERESISARVESAAAGGVPCRLTELERIFALAPFETQTIVACAAPELDLRFEVLYSYAQNDVNRKRPTVDLLLRLHSADPLDRMRMCAAFRPENSLLRNGLVALTGDPEQPLPARALRLDDRMVEYLLGGAGIDHRLRPFAECIEPRTKLSDLLLPHPLKQDLVNALAAFGDGPQLLLFRGAAGTGKQFTAETLSHETRRPLIVADLGLAAASAVALPDILALLRREAALREANLFLAHGDALQLHLDRDLFPRGCRIFLSVESDAASIHIPSGWPRLTFEFPLPEFEDRVRLWRRGIADAAIPAPDADAMGLANQFVLTPGAIHRACHAAAIEARLRRPRDPWISTADLAAAARAESNHALARLAQKVDTVHEWQDLVLPSRAMQQLREVVASHKHRHLVYSGWGFDRRLAMGKGLNVLFHGPSGTGKTMAAGILARELGLHIYKIDLSSVVSKYIGETEKQLNQLFREARTSNAILLFDEADALFGKRSETRDAHDRYANIETAYLLQRIEEYEGIVILTTNFRKNIDEAFSRRMQHVIEFPFPDVPQRLKIWTSIIPAGASLDGDIDFTFLARQFELPGGSIRNIALGAAFLAADEGAPMRMEHFILASAREMLKAGKLPSRSEFREYFDLIHSNV
ncbi:MAG TPA: ATP-binding protein [Verrucomicrobiae bacterium]|nr:ATP-binding protein [Verrucomicrobiae bacterium]